MDNASWSEKEAFSTGARGCIWCDEKHHRSMSLSAARIGYSIASGWRCVSYGLTKFVKERKSKFELLQLPLCLLSWNYQSIGVSALFMLPRTATLFCKRKVASNNHPEVRHKKPQLAARLQLMLHLQCSQETQFLAVTVNKSFSCNFSKLEFVLPLR